MDIIQILILLFFMFMGVSVSTGSQTQTQTATIPPPVPMTFPTATPSGPDVAVQIPTVVEQVEALYLESFPVQIHLHVTGYQPDGCDAPVHIMQTRAGDHVDVQIYRELPADVACPSVIQPYDANIPLDGNFPPGVYTITVNGVTIEART